MFPWYFTISSRSANSPHVVFLSVYAVRGKGEQERVGGDDHTYRVGAIVNTLKYRA